MRVPMRSTGTDHPVVAMKDGNASGAKGVDYSAGFNRDGEIFIVSLFYKDIRLNIHITSC